MIARLYCKWCGATDHVAGMQCPRMRTKKGSKDSATGSGDWTWYIPPDYSTWHSTIERAKWFTATIGRDGDGISRGHVPGTPWDRSTG